MTLSSIFLMLQDDDEESRDVWIGYVELYGKTTCLRHESKKTSLNTFFDTHMRWTPGKALNGCCQYQILSLVYVYTCVSIFSFYCLSLTLNFSRTLELTSSLILIKVTRRSCR